MKKRGFDHKNGLNPFTEDMEKTIAEKKKKQQGKKENKNSAGKKK